MNGEDNSYIYELTGEIVEIYEKDKNKFAKVKYDAGYIDICIDKIRDAHLNDKITVTSDILVKSIKPRVEEK